MLYFFFKQKTAYEMRISDWSSDVCSSDLPDLQDERFESRVAIFHQRYSTNTFPQWWLAQPFRTLAHNGEINTIRGNKNWMKSHEIKMASLAFGEHSEDIKPVIPAGASDTAALDAVFEALCRAGRDAPTAKLILVPEAWGSESDVPDNHRALYSYLASVMEPWDGPAALAMTDGSWAVAGMDRNSLRPLRFTLTADNRSEEARRVGKGCVSTCRSRWSPDP